MSLLVFNPPLISTFSKIKSILLTVPGKDLHDGAHSAFIFSRFSYWLGSVFSRFLSVSHTQWVSQGCTKVWLFWGVCICGKKEEDLTAFFPFSPLAFPKATAKRELACYTNAASRKEYPDLSLPTVLLSRSQVCFFSSLG